ncbi:FliM/FliN family flagellar motor C-terminal domain-containing protein [Arenibacterium halophilum]|uniref:FliM/FliN family flagellar motor switch protein n=1 Tax=Arenibacterium halophilum TaxID=2583821 RepID=A0ABY2XDJ2_9RHOB|nr:FliM/FliN family flagellar motor C-terminal domain-containing protein [Arenibacterium halophilum]TMV15044.1 FliM/FliN family flagellar motor switch protein [Arenibacterium halophilum]
MKDQGVVTTKLRKLAAGRDGPQGGGGRSILRALRLGAARAGRDVFSMALSVIGITQTRVLQDALPDHLSDDTLLILMDGPERRTGVMSLDRSGLMALIQQQTMNAVFPGDPSERAYTSTDAALIAPLAESILNLSTDIAESLADKACLRGYRFGARSADVRSVMLTVEAERFRIFDLTLEFGGGVRQGKMCIALPEVDPPKPAGDKANTSQRMMEAAVGAARAELDVVIGTVKGTLQDLAGLQPGALVTLEPRPSLSHAVIYGITGNRIATARLGQTGGVRAVRLNETPGMGQGARPPAGFNPGALPGAEDMPPDMGQMPEMPMPGSMVNGPAAWDDAGGSDIDLPMSLPDGLGEDDGEDAAPLPMAFGDISDDNPGDDFEMPAMSTMEISSLAGLTDQDEEES